MKIIKELYHRFKLPSPSFFVKLQKLCFLLGSILTGIGAYLLNNCPQSRLAVAITTFGGAILTIGTIISKLPVNEYEKLKEIIEAKPKE